MFHPPLPISTSHKTYLVTGAAGFIASQVCEQLLAAGHTVVGIDNLNDYYDVRLKDYRLGRLLGSLARPRGNNPRVSVYAEALQDETKGPGSQGTKRPRDQGTKGPRDQGTKGLLENSTGSQRVLPYKDPAQEPRTRNQEQRTKNQEPTTNNQQPITKNHEPVPFTFLPLDIENLPALDALFTTHRFDAVFNLAARAGVRYSLENPHVYLTTNAHGTLNLLECMRRHGVKKQVLASTSSLYAGCPLPFTEDQPVNTPLSPYAASKKAAEMMAYSYHQLYGLDISVVRYFTVFGPAGRPDMAPHRFVHWVATGQPIRLFGDGTQTRDFTYVDDIARGTVLAAQPVGYEVINLGGGNRPVSINAIIGFIESQLGQKAVIERLPANPVDMTDTQADITKAGRLLGWKPEVAPEAGFTRTVAWYRENRDWLKDVGV